MPAPKVDNSSFSSGDIARLSGLRTTLLRRYVARGLLRPKRTRGRLCFDWPDLVRARSWARLSKTTRGRVLRMVAQTGAHVVVDPFGSIGVRDDDGWADPMTGQRILAFGGGAVVLGRFRGVPLSAHTTCAADELAAGYRYHLQRKLSRALAAYRSALRLGGPAGPLWFNIGVALEDAGRPRHAVAAYERAVRADRKLADAHFNAARLCAQHGASARALRHWHAYRALQAES